jgi:small conductance mechanosensitive channel
MAILLLLTVASTTSTAQSDASSQQSADELSALHQRIDATVVENRKLEKLISESEGDVRTLLERRLERNQIQVVDDINLLTSKVVEQEAAGEELPQMRKVMSDYLSRLMPALQQQIDRKNDEMLSSISAAPAKSKREAMSREIATNKAMTTLVDWYSAYDRSVENLDTFGIDAAAHRAYLSDRLVKLAEFLADGVNLATEEIEDTSFLLTLTPADEDLKVELKLQELRRTSTVDNLRTVAALLEKLEIDSSEYKSLILRTSGDVSTGILETGVWANLLKQWGESTWEFMGENSLNWILKLIVLVLILYVARALSRVTRRIVEQAVSRINLSHLLRRMIVATAANGVFIIGILIALSQLGISVGPVLAGLGIAGIIIGFALQDTLANFASGMMILVYRPYDVGDLVDAGGEFGTVTDMNLVSTVILTIDNQTLVVPNNLIWRGVIRNVTAQKNRRIDMTFGISYDDDIPKAERVLKEIIDAHDKVLDDPEPMIKLHTLGESSVDFIVRPWVKTDDYWDVYWDITREVKMRFDAEGISIPFPQRDLHIYNTATQAEAKTTSDQMSTPKVSSS